MLFEIDTKDFSEETCEMLAKETTNPDLLDYFAKNGSTNLKISVAGNNNIREETLHDIVTNNSNNFYIMFKAVYNPAISTKTLEWLIHFGIGKVSRIARNILLERS